MTPPATTLPSGTKVPPPPPRDPLAQVKELLWTLLCWGTPRVFLDELRSQIYAERTARTLEGPLSPLHEVYFGMPEGVRAFAILSEVRDRKFDDERLPGETFEQQRERERARLAGSRLEDSALVKNAGRRRDDTMSISVSTTESGELDLRGQLRVRRAAALAVLKAAGKYFVTRIVPFAVATAGSAVAALHLDKLWGHR